MDAVLAADLVALGAAMRSEVDAMGIRFESVDGDDSWHVDPIPRVIPGDAWERLAAGLAQRVRALNAFVGDVYGRREIVAEDVMPQRVLDSADHVEPGMTGVRPPGDVWVGIAGLDVVRDAVGEWLVLEDNVRTPSGLGYWPAAREATLRALDVPADALPRPLDGMGDALRRVFGPGHVVVLTDGPDNSAFWEHEWIAERLGVPLVQPDDLSVRDGRIHHRGAVVDTIYRRTNDDEVDSEVGRLLHPAVAASGVRLINCFGTGVADD